MQQSLCDVVDHRIDFSRVDNAHRVAALDVQVDVSQIPGRVGKRLCPIHLSLVDEGFDGGVSAGESLEDNP